MSSSFYVLGKEHIPPKDKIRKLGEKSWIGNRWKIWAENEHYYIEFDAGHFMDKFIVVEISEDDYLSFEREKSENSILEIIRRYSKKNI